VTHTSGDIELQPVGVPPPEVEITDALVRSLLETQHSDLASEPLSFVGAGWDNATFRLGTQFAVRLPRRQLGARLIGHEQAWLPALAPLLPLPVPAPVRMGLPGCGYPWRWSIVPWLDGVSADLSPPDEAQAERLAAFFRALHRAAPSDAPMNPYRGVRLSERRESINPRMGRVQRATDALTDEVRAAWHRALEAPVDVEPSWLHGDLHPQNVLVRDGVISGIVDWGDLCRGDRATDLAAIWMLLASRRARLAAIDFLHEVSEATWGRARGWAVSFGVVLLDSGLAGDPRHGAMGAQILQRIADGP
jgi:aminoglycoside phosphotransferase (APT) family kinase protein